MSRNDGGYAFPLFKPSTEQSYFEECQHGMTLRQRYAEKAMQVILQAVLTDDTAAAAIQKEIDKEGSSSEKIMSRKAFNMADHMIAEEQDDREG